MSNRHAYNWKGKSDKHRRACTLYRSLNKWLTNKIRKLERHIKKQPNEEQAKEALKRLKS